MLSRPRILHNVLTLVISLLLVSPATLASADENPFDCHVEFNGRKWDLTKLAGEHIALRTRSSPPSSMVDKLRFDLCDDLKELDDIDAHDQVDLHFFITTTAELCSRHENTVVCHGHPSMYYNFQQEA